jgi:putative photosynthetic complex assembly protein
LSSLDDKPFPRGALIGAGLMILSTVAGVGTIQLQKFHAGTLRAAPTINAAAVETRDLRFIDLQDGVSVFGGHVQVFDAVTGAELPQLRERDGFVRAVLNSLAYERTKRGLSAPTVFQLTRWSDDRITISDPVTNARINLADFGHGNKTVFLRFFPSSEAGQ